MKRKRFSMEQIVAVQKQGEVGVPVAKLTRAQCSASSRRVAISERTFYRWKKQNIGLEMDQVRQLKQQQEESTRLKRLVADHRTAIAEFDPAVGQLLDRVLT